MIYKTIRDCWSIICDLDDDLVFSKNNPMYKIEKYLSLYKINNTKTNHEKNKLISNYELPPSFKNINNEIIASLRNSIDANINSYEVNNWAETIMRFCEIRLKELEKRSIDKTKDALSGQLLILHIASFLMDMFEQCKDFRYLNTVLKISDLEWLIDKKSIHKMLNGEKRKVEIGIFQFRVLIATEYAIEKLREDLQVE